MIWPFRARCPLDLHEKVWTELRLARLAVDFGTDRLLIGNDVFNAADRIFPEQSAFATDTRSILSMICEQMRFDADRITIKPEPPTESELAVTQGAWEIDDDGRYIVRIRDAEAGGVELQAAILARVVGCTLLVERGSFHRNDADDWLRAELTPVGMGFGPMIANMTLAVVSDYWFTSRIFQYGHLPSHLTGYALAVLCWLGGDNEPGYGSSLRRDAAAAYRQGLRYLHQTGDCLIPPGDWGRSIENRDVSVLLSDLSNRSESRRLAALWELMEHDADASQAVTAVAARLQDGHPVIRLNAAVLLGKWGRNAAPALSELKHAIGSERDDRVRMEAVRAIGTVCEAAEISAADHNTLVDDLLDLRERVRIPRVRNAALEALSRLGVDVHVIGPDLARGIRDSIADASDERLRTLLDCVRRIEPDVEGFLKEHFSDRDPELLTRACATLREQETPDSYAGFPEPTRGSIMTNWRWA